MIRQIRHFFCRQDGVVAVEFALIALPFFILLMGMIEISLYFAAGTVLEGGAAAASRTIRTGQAQLSADPESVFETALCNHVSVMLNCDNIQYEVIHVEDGTFAGAEDYAPEFDSDGNLVPSGFATGNSNDVVMVRVLYRYAFLTPFIGTMMTGGVGDNTMVHMAVSVLRAEPYNFGED